MVLYQIYSTATSLVITGDDNSVIILPYAGLNIFTRDEQYVQIVSNGVVKLDILGQQILTRSSKNADVVLSVMETINNIISQQYTATPSPETQSALSRYHVKEADVLLIAESYQWFLYGDLTIDGFLKVDGQLVVTKGMVDLTGGGTLDLSDGGTLMFGAGL